MKKRYLIQYRLEDTDIFEGRIKNIGDWYKFFTNSWIVESELSAKDIYKKLSIDNEDKSVFVIEIHNNNYYGRMNVKLWEYLKPRRDK